MSVFAISGAVLKKKLILAVSVKVNSKFSRGGLFKWSQIYNPSMRMVQQIGGSPSKIRMDRTQKLISSLIEPRWLNRGKFNTSKSKRVKFNHHRADPTLLPIMRGRFSINEPPSLKRLFGLKLTQGLKQNSYIRFIAKDSGKIVSSYCRFNKYLIPSAMHYHYKSEIIPKMQYCCHICVASVQFSLTFLESLSVYTAL